MNQPEAALNGPTISDERIRNVLRKHIEIAIKARKTTSRPELSNDSGVALHHIDAIMSSDPAKHRRVATEDALSLAHALGPQAVKALLALFGWTGHPVDEPDEMQPMLLAATAMHHIATIATAAADGRIDHLEAPACREASDLIIATVLPLSSMAQRA